MYHYDPTIALEELQEDALQDQERPLVAEQFHGPPQRIARGLDAACSRLGHRSPLLLVGTSVHLAT